MTNEKAIAQINSKIFYLERMRKYGNYDEIIEALEMARFALQKQIPIRPEIYDDCERFFIECPICHKRFDSRSKYNGCPYCLQAISFNAKEKPMIYRDINEVIDSE